MKNHVSSFGPAALLTAFMAVTRIALAQEFQVIAVDVDNSGNINSVDSQFVGSGGVLDQQLKAGPTNYFSGAFVSAATWAYAGSQWNFQRTINGGQLATRPAFGLPAPPNHLSANNVLILVYNKANDSLTFSALTAGYYGGSGNGCNGRVRALTLSRIGDLYVGGDFTEAGGFPYSSGIGVYNYQYGWNTAYIFSAFNNAYSFNWVTSTKLEVNGSSPNGLYQVNFMGNVLNVNNNTAYWNTVNAQFGMYDYWSAQ